jgi:hypothetical protein
VNTFFKRSLLFSGVVVVICIAVFGWQVYSKRNPPTHRHTLILASLKPGLRLVACDSVADPDIVPEIPDYWLELRGGGNVIKIGSLEDLKGEVSIDSPQIALMFVRLKTSLGSYRLWRDSNCAVEVVNGKLAGAMPTFGSTIDFDPDSTPGLISQNDFTRAGFISPIVETVAGHYVITRWLLTLDMKTGWRFDKVRETVAPDGGYNITVLASEPPPKLPHSHWQIQVQGYM